MPEMRPKNKGSTVECILQTYGMPYTIASLYFLGNALMFLYVAKDEYTYHDDFQKYATSIARGAGAVLNFNMALVLLLASRMLIKFLRETPLSLIAPVDLLMPVVHGIIGSINIGAAAAHTVAHCVTYIIKHPWSTGISGTISLFITGWIICFALIAIRVTSWPIFRAKYHEGFRRCHVGCSLLIYAILPMHGFHRGVPSSWKWIVGPVLLYSLDYLLRLLRERRSYLLLTKHSGAFQGQSILRLRLPRVFHFQPGQYAELKVPEISKYQWHPFTIASAPHESEMVFYVKSAGNWTTKLFQLFAHRLSHPSSTDIEVHVRGPFGAPAQHVDQFEHLILVGGGVGATPFCSVVKSLFYWMNNWSPFANNDSSDRIQSCADGLNAFEDETAPKEQRSNVKQASGSCRSWNLVDGSTEQNSSFFTANSHLTRKICENDMNSSSRSSRLSPSASIDIEENYATCSSALETTQAHRTASARSGEFAENMNEAIHKSRYKGTRDFNKNEWEEISIESYRRDVSYWNAVNSLPSRTSQSATYYQSLELLIGMNYVPPPVVRHMQVRKLQRSAEYLSGQVFSGSAIDDLSIFHDRTFLFLIYSKSVTANMLLLWTVLLRWFVAGLGGLLDEVSLLRNGLAIYKSNTWLICDTCLALVIFLAISVPALLEIYHLGPSAPISWVDYFVLVPVTVFGVVTNCLAIKGIGSGTTMFGIVTLLLVWPLTVLLVIVRLVRTVGDRVSYGENLHRAAAVTKSVKFFWTAQTQEDDGWLVGELLPCVQNNIQLYRFITRSEAKEEEWMAGLDQIPFRTEYQRPDWETIFNDLAEKSSNGSTIGVFLCGPTPMSKQVEEAAMTAMRNSIVRGLQKGVCPMKRLEEVFGDTISANPHTGESARQLEGGEKGCNIKMVFHKERFS